MEETVRELNENTNISKITNYILNPKNKVNTIFDLTKTFIDNPYYLTTIAHNADYFNILIEEKLHDEWGC